MTSVRVFCRSQIEDGFFHPPGDGGPVEHDAAAFWHPLEGAPATGIHFFRVVIDDTAAKQTHLVLSLHGQRLDPQEEPLHRLQTALERRFPEAMISFIDDDRVGFARVLAQHQSPATAAAVACIKYNCGWDESDPIVIAFDHIAYNVSIHFGNDVWRVEIVPR